MGVVGARGPALHRKAELVVGVADIGEELDLGAGVDLELDADPRHHRRDRRANLLVHHIAVVRAIHCQLEAVGIAGLGQQCLRLGDIDGGPFVERRVVAVDPGPVHQPGRVALAAQHALDDGVLVDRQRQGAADPDILQRVFALDAGEQEFVAVLVHRQIDRAQFGAFDQPNAGGLADALGVLRRHRVDHVHHAR